MATDYAKKTVAELQEILKSRSLPHTGKKAELVARLGEDDQSKEQADAPAIAAAAQTEQAEPIPAQQPTLAKPLDPVDAPAVPAPPAPSTDPNSTTNAVPDPSTSAETTTAQQANFSANLSSTTLQSELEKRKARAARFGASADTVEDTEKAVQRAQRFGAANAGDGAGDAEGVKGLDQALPERRERRGGGGGGGRGGRHRGRGGGGGGRGGRGTTPQRVGEKGSVQKPATAYSSDKDRSAAEKRLQRFAQA